MVRVDLAAPAVTALMAVKRRRLCVMAVGICTSRIAPPWYILSPRPLQTEGTKRTLKPAGCYAM